MKGDRSSTVVGSDALSVEAHGESSDGLLRHSRGTQVQESQLRQWDQMQYHSTGDIRLGEIE